MLSDFFSLRLKKIFVIRTEGEMMKKSQMKIDHIQTKNKKS